MVKNAPVDVSEQTPGIDTSPDGASGSPEDVLVASQWSLVWRRLKRHHLAIAAGVVLIFVYFVAIFAEFFAPYTPFDNNSARTFAPPQRIRIIGPEGLTWPFVYDFDRTVDPESFRRLYTPNEQQMQRIRLFVRGGERYRLLGLFPTDLRLFGVDEGRIYLLGADRLGRDVLSRIIYGVRISSSIGLIGVMMSFVFGLLIGGFSGYYGGVIDNVIQRFIEFIRSIPTLPLWMALSAALPPHWPPMRIYLFITIILSILGWTGLARVVRSKFLSLRHEDFVVASRLIGCSEFRVIFRHMLPSFMSHVIAAITLAVPHMILGETALSFLGLGLRAPIVSLGVLMQEAQNVATVAQSPWLLLPGVAVIIIVLAFNFLGDGLRDAADPYSTV